MRNHPPSLYLLLSLGLDQLQESVEGPPRLERADALVILAFEKEAQVRARWSLAFEWSVGERLDGPRGGGDGIEGLAGQEGGAVHMLLDEAVSCVDGGGSEGLSRGPGHSV